MKLPEIIENFDYGQFWDIIKNSTPDQVDKVLLKSQLSFSDFPVLLSQAAGVRLPYMATLAREATIQRFGKIIQFYAPLYLSNACENHCLYCGFNCSSHFPRKILNHTEIEQELTALKKTGMDSILLLTGESPRAAGIDYIAEAVRSAGELFTFTGLEIYPMETGEYTTLVEAGADGLTIYQETYDREIYEKMHIKGRKQDYLRRLDTPDRAFRGGIRKVGLGVLLGLSDWRLEAVRMALHLRYLQKQYWKGELTLSFPRIQPFSTGFQVPSPVDDRSFIQMICAMRLLFPDIGFILSTREEAVLRDRLIELCITQMSAGSKTNPGGYTSADSEEQFSIADERELEEMIRVVSHKGYEPVLKDWDKIFSKKC